MIPPILQDPGLHGRRKKLLGSVLEETTSRKKAPPLLVDVHETTKGEREHKYRRDSTTSQTQNNESITRQDRA